ncbi:Uncharacterised protein [Chlamydia trachomatis]|nr:Uncharacterised protein [Chlamydia trachomatis]
MSLFSAFEKCFNKAKLTATPEALSVAPHEVPFGPTLFVES